MNTLAQIPSWLSIVRLDDRRYQLTDTSVASIGYCLGIFPCREAAESIAAKIAQSRATGAVRQGQWVKPAALASRTQDRVAPNVRALDSRTRTTAPLHQPA